jgi:hypothetical protein
VRAKVQPKHCFGFIELEQFAAVFWLMVCPHCTEAVTLWCEDWWEVGGGFSTTIQCSMLTCKFFVKFTSTSPMASNPHRQDAPTQYWPQGGSLVTWGITRIRFERLKAVFALAGGILPIKRTGFAQLMKKVV